MGPRQKTQRDTNDNGNIEDKKTRRTNTTTHVDRRVTRAMTEEATDKVRKAVLTTPELLENILVHLPVKDIYKARRVSKQFRDVIAVCPDIKTRLFMRLVEPDTRVWATDFPPGQDPRFWRVASTIAPNSRGSGTIQWRKGLWRYMKRRSGHIYLRPVWQNPMLRLLQNTSPFTHWAHRMRFGPPQSFVLNSWELNSWGRDCALKDLLRPVNDSRSVSYLTDPPCFEASISFQWGTPRGNKYNDDRRASGYYECFVDTGRALTLGDMYSALINRAARIQSYYAS